MTARWQAAGWRPMALLSVVLLAACGGAPADQPRPDGASGSSAQPGASGSEAPAALADAGSGPEGATAPPACELLSESDIVELTTWGSETVTTAPQQGIFQNGCYWELAGGTSAGMGAPASITLGVMAAGGQQYYDEFFAPFAEENGDEPLVGVGDVGLIGSPSGTVMAVRDDVLVSLQWIDLGGDETPVAITLIERVLANLGG